MIKKKFLISFSFLVCLVFLFGCVTTKSGRFQPEAGAGGENENTGSMGRAGIQTANEGCLEEIIFDRVKGDERLTLCVSKLSGFNVERISEETIMIKLVNMVVTAELMRKFSEDSSRVIDHALPLQKTIEGERWVYFKIALKKMVPYSVKEEEKRIVIAFDASAISRSFPTVVKEASAVKKDDIKGETAAPAKFSYLTRKPLQKEKEEKTGASKEYTGEKITLDFQDADIKDVLRLISEVSNFNIVTAPDVKGNVSMNMKKVPWDHALDTILEANSLSKKVSGNVITIFTLAAVNKMDKDRKKAEETQREKDAAEGKLRQISIEAKIVEAVTSFSRKLGVQWGGGYKGHWNNADFGILGGTNPSGGVTSLPSGIGLTGDRLAVNFPIAIDAPSIGIAIGGSQAILDAQLRALEDTGEGKIISSPKVTTLDGVEAMIEQGEEVPYKKLDESGNTTIEWKKAVLQLNVTPVITPNGEISLKIKSLNDYADWARAEKTQGDPPIIKNTVESTVVAKDGDTIVVGGIYKSSETEGTSGVPWLSKIPILGWLFKTEYKTREKREILIFITPRIIGETLKGEYAKENFQ